MSTKGNSEIRQKMQLKNIQKRIWQLARELSAYIRKICQQKAGTVFKQKENKDLPACQRAEGIYTKALYLVYVKKMVQS